jgi:hypothetical protein
VDDTRLLPYNTWIYRVLFRNVGYPLKVEGTCRGTEPRGADEILSTRFLTAPEAITTEP